MKLTFEVKRIRASVTQGEAIVLCNGETLITFGDTIELNKQNKQWESMISDAEFIASALFPSEMIKQAYPDERVRNIELKIKNILEVNKDEE